MIPATSVSERAVSGSAVLSVGEPERSSVGTHRALWLEDGLKRWNVWNAADELRVLELRLESICDSARLDGDIPAAVPGMAEVAPWWSGAALS